MVGVSPGLLSSDGGRTLLLVGGGGGGFDVGCVVAAVTAVAATGGPMAISCCLFSLWICSAGAAVDAACFPLSFTFSFLLREIRWHYDWKKAFN